VTVFNYCGITLGEAKQLIPQAGLALGVVFPGEAGDDWLIDQQSPAAGQQVPPNTPVDLLVSSPADPPPSCP
jgi:beta-lactam-binding protein with PASTA domain